MSTTSQHALDRRAQMLADKIKHFITTLASALRPEGANPPFTEQITSAEALKFWRRNRYSPLGAKILAGYTPMQIVGLDTWLSRHPDPSLSGPPSGTPLLGARLPTPGFGPPLDIGAPLIGRSGFGSTLPTGPRSAPLQDIGD